MQLSPEHDKQLCETFPELFKFRHADDNDSRLGRGFGIGDGWFSIIVDLCKKLEVIAGLAEWTITARSVYQRMGKLRFIYNIDKGDTTKDTEVDTTLRYIVSDLVWRAELRSTRVCEVCGRSGRLEQINGWFSSRCPECRQKYGTGRPAPGLNDRPEFGNERSRYGNDF